MTTELDQVKQALRITREKLVEREELVESVLSEYSAWLNRNAKRNELRNWIKEYREDVGEYFDRDECKRFGDIDHVYQFDSLREEATKAQRVLDSARARTRRNVKALLAQLGE